MTNKPINKNESPEETINLADDRLFWFCQVDIEVLRDPELSPTDKAVYAIICSFASVADRSGRPSIGTIADATNCSKNTARSAIKNLVSRGVLVREERYCDGRQTSCLYKIIGVNAYRSSKSEGGRVQILKGEGSKNDRQELEPKELDLKDPLSEGADAPDGQNPLSPDEETFLVHEEPLSADDTALLVNEEPLPENDAALKKIPSAMHETVEFMLLKTGRSGLLPEEIGPIMALEKIHLPSRIQREISRAADRFKSKDKPLSSLTFVYIYDSLKYQQSKKTGKAEPKPPEMSEENKAWEAANLARMEEEFGSKGGGGNAGQR